jgi:hypothetical protein
MMNNLKNKNKKEPKKTEPENNYDSLFGAKKPDKFTTPGTKKGQTTSKKKGKKRNEHIERVLTNIGCGDEKIYKLSELYRPGDPKVLKNCMDFIEKHSGMKILKEFESNCLLEPYDLNEQYREFEKNIKGGEDDESKDAEEETMIQEESMELKEFYEGEQGQVEKYWDQMIPNSQSLSRIFRKKLINPKGALGHLNHIELESVLLRKGGASKSYSSLVSLAKRNDEGRDWKEIKVKTSLSPK